MAKEHLTLATIGHVRSGKSTLCGRFLFELGGMSERDLKKLRKSAIQYGNELNLFAFFMDTLKDERSRAGSIQCTSREFFTNKYHYTLIDLPGHTKFTKNMIKGASQTDVALLMVPADNEFEESSKTNNQTVQHSTICYALGIKQMIVCINKMDDPFVNYRQKRFNEIKHKIQQLLKSIGFDINQIPFIPLSALKGDNLVVTNSDKMKWYKGFEVKINDDIITGYTLLDALDKVIQKPKRFMNEPFRMYVYDKWKIKGVGDVITGKIQQGSIAPGMCVQFLPRNNIKGKVFSLEMNNLNIEKGKDGDCVGLNIKGLRKDNMPQIGDLMIVDNSDQNKKEDMMNVRYFVALMFIQYHPSKIKKGYEISMHIGTQRVQCTILSIHWKKGKSIDNKMVEYPEYIESGDTAEIVFKSQTFVIIYPFKDSYNKSLNKIIGLDWNRVIMFGKINDNAYDFCRKILVYGYIRINKLDVVNVIQDRISKYLCL